MIKFNLLSLSVILFLSLLTVSNNFFIFPKSVQVDAIPESSSSTNSNNPVAVITVLPMLSSVSPSSKSSSSNNSSKSSLSTSTVKSSSIVSSSSKSSNSTTKSAISSSGTSSTKSSSSSSSSIVASSKTPSNNSSQNSSLLIAGSKVSSSSKNSSNLINVSSVPAIKITEVGFTRFVPTSTPNYKAEKCDVGINSCNKFKWIEIYNPNNYAINLKNYKIDFNGLKNANKIESLEINSKDFGYIVDTDNFLNLTNKVVLKNTGTLDYSDEINLEIVDQNNTLINDFVVNNISKKVDQSKLKFKTSFFRCVDSSQNQNYTLTEINSNNKITTNTLGYEFYGTPGKDDDSCKPQINANQTVITATPTITKITTTPTVDPIIPKIELKAQFKATQTIAEPIKTVVTEPMKIPEGIKETITSRVKINIPEMVPTQALVSQIIPTNQLPKVVVPNIQFSEVKSEFKAVENTEVKEAIAEIKPIENKLLKYYSKAKIVETKAVENHTIQNLNKNIAMSIIQSKVKSVANIEQKVTPITKKVFLPAELNNPETVKVLEIDYQPAQSQWNFLSLIAVVYVFSKSYSEFKNKISLSILRL